MWHLATPMASLQWATLWNDYSSISHHKLTQELDMYFKQLFQFLHLKLVNVMLMVFVFSTIWGCCHCRWWLKKQCFSSGLPPFTTKATNDLDSKPFHISSTKDPKVLCKCKTSSFHNLPWWTLLTSLMWQDLNEDIQAVILYAEYQSPNQQTLGVELQHVTLHRIHLQGNFD